MRHWTAAALVVCVLACAACGAAFATPLSLVRQPYLQNVSSDTIVVMWKTDVASDSRVDYGATSSYTDFVYQSALTQVHEVHLAGLDPDAIYHYRITSQAGVEVVHSADSTLKTATTGTTAFRFAVYGDSRSQPSVHAAVVQSVIGSAPEFVLHTGDFVTDGSVDTWQSEFFNPAAPLLANTPFFPCLGNHEQNSPNYYANFDPPDGGGDYGERWYAFDYGNAHFMVVDTDADFSPGSAQYQWLENELSATTAQWRFVFHHHPPYSSGGHGGTASVQSYLVPLYETYGVSIVFNGHDHDYERSYRNGVYYIVTGGGGAPIGAVNVNSNSYQQYAEASYHHCTVDVNGDRITLEAHHNDGGIFDTLTLTFPVVAEAGPNKTIFSGGSATLEGSASGGQAPYTYSWSPTAGLNNPNVARPTASPASTTTYTLTVHDALAQTATDTATVTVTVPVDDAVVASATLPASVLRNRAQGIQITIQNTGNTTWTAADGYALSSVNPNDNTTWGLNRAELSPSDSIAPGQSKTFSFNITAPNQATYLTGPIHCDWQMIHGSTRFGAVSANTLNVYSFADVTPDLSYWRYVEAAYTAGLTAGCGSDYRGPLYCPLSNCTRAMMAVFLVRAKGMTPLMSPTPKFADVPSSLSYYGHVERLADPASWYDAGNPCLTTPTAGCAPGPLYCPDTNCTRAMMAVFLCRAAGKCPYTVQERPTPTFADVGTSLSYYGFVERLADAASWNNDPPTAGCAPNPPRFCPDQVATRAQMAVFLARGFALPYQ